MLSSGKDASQPDSLFAAETLVGRERKGVGNRGGEWYLFPTPPSPLPTPHSPLPTPHSPSPPDRHPIRAGIIAEVIIVYAEEEPSVFIRLARRPAARADEDEVRISPVAVANLADQRAGPDVIHRIVRSADARVAVAVGTAVGAVADSNRPFGRDGKRHVRLDIDARIGPGLIGVNGDGLLARLACPRPAVRLITRLARSRSSGPLADPAAINNYIDAEGATGVARLPMIDGEIENAVTVGGEFA